MKSLNSNVRLLRSSFTALPGLYLRLSALLDIATRVESREPRRVLQSKSRFLNIVAPSVTRLLWHPSQ